MLGEAQTCPSCGLGLLPMSRLPVSGVELADSDDEWAENPDWVSLGWGYLGRGRGVLFGVGVVGIVLFFLPWVRVLVPDHVVMSGADMARVLWWIWGCLVSWGMLVATVVSRRSIGGMRGARVVAALFCAIPVICVVVLLLTPPTGGRIPIRFDYGWSFFATGVVGLIGIPFGVCFGGKSAARDIVDGGGAS